MLLTTQHASHSLTVSLPLFLFLFFSLLPLCLSQAFKRQESGLVRTLAMPFDPKAQKVRCPVTVSNVCDMIKVWNFGTSACLGWPLPRYMLIAYSS